MIALDNRRRMDLEIVRFVHQYCHIIVADRQNNMKKQKSSFNRASEVTSKVFLCFACANIDNKVDSLWIFNKEDYPLLNKMKYHYTKTSHFMKYKGISTFCNAHYLKRHLKLSQ
jgi:hypothetical protein